MLKDRTTDKNRDKITRKKALAQVAHLVLPDTQTNASQNQMCHFFANTRTEIQLEMLFLQENNKSRNNANRVEMNVVTSSKIKKSSIVLISVGLLNFVHGMLHVIQFLQSMVLIAYSTERTDHHSERILDSILHHPMLAFLWAIIGLLTFIIGIKDFRHHRKCGNGHKH